MKWAEGNQEAMALTLKSCGISVQENLGGLLAPGHGDATASLCPPFSSLFFGVGRRRGRSSSCESKRHASAGSHGETQESPKGQLVSARETL